MALRQATPDFADAPLAPDAARPHTGVSLANSGAPTSSRIQLWDWPLRVFHWSLVAAVTTAIVSGKVGGAWMPLHSKAGIAVVGLIAFRLVWGFAGSTHARFASFVPTPGKVLAYVKGQWQGLGHNPLGALSVLALLSVLGAQAASGLFSNDDIAFTGQLAGLIDEDLSQKLTAWHHQLANVVFIVLGLHVAAIVFYARVKKHKLVKPMVTGWKDVPAGTPAPRQASPVALLLAVLVGLSAAYGASGLWIKTPAAAAAPTSADNTAPTTSDTTSADVSPGAAPTATAPQGASAKATPAW